MQTSHYPLPPGPPGHLFFGSLFGFWRDPIQPFLDGWRQYGDVVRFRFGGPFEGYLLANPDHIRLVLQERHRTYRKVPWYNDKLKDVVGEGLLTSEGDSWLRQRRLIQPAFHQQRLTGLVAITAAATQAMLEQRWQLLLERGEPFDLASELMRLTLTVVGQALFSTDVSRDAATVGWALPIELEHTSRRMQAYLDLPMWLPLPRNLRFRQARRAIDAIVFRIIDERRRAGVDTGDLLSMLLQAQDENDGAGMTDQQVRDEVMTLFLAGHETTAVAMTWTFYLLSQHPAVAMRLRQELASVLNGRLPALEDLPKLSYTRMVIEEAMRLYPPAWALTRRPIDDDVIGGYRIPAGRTIFLIPYVTHRHPDYWENPEAFDPDRFSSERSAARPRFAYFPFGGGPRQCIGNQFAMMEATVILATIAQRFDLAHVPGHPIGLRPLVTLRPKHGMLMTLRPVPTLTASLGSALAR